MSGLSGLWCPCCGFAWDMLDGSAHCPHCGLHTDALELELETEDDEP